MAGKVTRTVSPIAEDIPECSMVPRLYHLLNKLIKAPDPDPDSDDIRELVALLPEAASLVPSHYSLPEFQDALRDWRDTPLDSLREEMLIHAEGLRTVLADLPLTQLNKPFRILATKIDTSLSTFQNDYLSESSLSAFCKVSDPTLDRISHYAVDLTQHPARRTDGMKVADQFRDLAKLEPGARRTQYLEAANQLDTLLTTLEIATTAPLIANAQATQHDVQTLRDEITTLQQSIAELQTKVAKLRREVVKDELWLQRLLNVALDGIGIALTFALVIEGLRQGVELTGFFKNVPYLNARKQAFAKLAMGQMQAAEANLCGSLHTQIGNRWIPYKPWLLFRYYGVEAATAGAVAGGLAWGINRHVDNTLTREKNNAVTPPAAPAHLTTTSISLMEYQSKDVDELNTILMQLLETKGTLSDQKRTLVGQHNQLSTEYSALIERKMALSNSWLEHHGPTLIGFGIAMGYFSILYSLSPHHGVLSAKHADLVRSLQSKVDDWLVQQWDAGKLSECQESKSASTPATAAATAFNIDLLKQTLAKPEFLTPEEIATLKRWVSAAQHHYKTKYYAKSARSIDQAWAFLNATQIPRINRHAGLEIAAYSALLVASGGGLLAAGELPLVTLGTTGRQALTSAIEKWAIPPVPALP